MNEEEGLAKTGEAADTGAMESMLQEHVDTPASQPEIEETPTQTPVPEKKDEPETPPAAQPEKKDGEPETPETPAKPEKPEEKKDEPKVGDAFEKDIDAVQLRKDAAPRTREAFDAIKTKAKTEHQRAVTAETELATLKKLDVITPEQRKYIVELEQFKSTFDIENDPRFTAQFTTAITQLEDHGLNLLKSWNLPESAAKYIKDTGGILKFRYSNEPMPESFKNSDGSRMTRQQWWDKTIVAKLSPDKKDEINDVVAGLRNTTRQRDLTIGQVKQNKEAYLKQMAESENQSTTEWVKRVQTHAVKVLEKYGDAAKEKKIEQNDTPEVKAEKEKHNERFRKAEEVANKYLSNVTPENLTEAAIGMAYLSILEDTNKELVAGKKTDADKITELEKQIKSIKDSASTGRRVTFQQTPKTGTPSIIRPQTGKNADEANMERMIADIP